MPSKEDVLLTKRLRKCGSLMGIELLDHVIIGGTSGEMFSFKEKNMLDHVCVPDIKEKKCFRSDFTPYSTLPYPCT